MLPDVCGNALLVDLVLLKVAGAGQPGRVEDANLGRRLHLFPTLKNAATHQYSLFAHKFVKPSRLGPTLIAKNTSFVGVVKDVEVIVVNIFS